MIRVRVRSEDKARQAFATSKDIIHSLVGFHYITDTVTVLYATGKKFVERGELVYVGKAYNSDNQMIGDRYEYRPRA
jgi:hypothetical protein